MTFQSSWLSWILLGSVQISSSLTASCHLALERLQAHLGLTNHNDVFQKMIELQPEYWPEAKRKFEPIDIEYLCCECRKYYSYVNGTKTFEGKNVFTPGKSPEI